MKLDDQRVYVQGDNLARALAGRGAKMVRMKWPPREMHPNGKSTMVPEHLVDEYMEAGAVPA